MNSYQKLKEENKRLKQDIYTLVRKSDTLEGLETKMKYDMKYKVEDLAWSGTYTKTTTYDGFISKLNGSGT